MLSAESVLAKINIVDVVSKYRTLIRHGKSFKVLCPFHNDHKPSMIVDPEKNFCWCFACQNGGNALVFLQKIENISFKEALHLLADMAGISKEEQNQTSGSQQRSTIKKTKEEQDIIREVLQQSLAFFLAEKEASHEAKAYITEKRKFSEHTINKFQLGFAPKSFHALEKHLLEKKISRKDMIQAGVVSEKENNESYDKFRNRIMFPIFDGLGKLCGFGGRSLDGEEPKYMNSPETIIYKKSEILFGYHLAKKSIREQDTALIVEGNFDVMMCHQHGFENAVASSGIGFSEQQAKMIKRIASRVVLAFDADNAGMQATERILPILFTAGLSVSVMQLHNAKDPDEALQNNAEEFKNAYHTATPALQYLVEKKLTGLGHGSIEQKRKILDEIFPLIAHLPFPLEKNDAIKMVAAKLNIEEKIMQEEWNVFEKKEQKKYTPQNNKKISPVISYTEHFWGMMFAFCLECHYAFEVLQEDFFIESYEKTLYKFLFSAYTTQRAIAWENIAGLVSDEKWQMVQKSAVYCSQQYGHLPEGIRREEIKKATDAMGKMLIPQKIKHVLQHHPSDISYIMTLTQSLRHFK